MADFRVIKIEASSTMSLADGVLSVDTDAIRLLVSGDERIQDVRVSLVNADESVRLVHVLDCMIPICKRDGSDGVFPGVLSDSVVTSSEPTHLLRGVVVTALGIAARNSSRFSQKEAIIDLGMATALSPLSRVNHVVIEFEFTEETGEVDRQHAAAKGLAIVAERLAKVTVGLECDGDVGEVSPPRDLPQVAHICQVSAFAPLFDTRLLGCSLRGMLPTVVSGDSLIDGWVVSGDYHYASTRNLTCFFQDSPLRAAVEKLALDAEIATTILLPVGESQVEKERGALLAAEMARSLGMDGGIITSSAAGNAHVDMMLVARACEERGISTGLILVELAGAEGDDGGLVYQVPEADLIICTGNREELVDLPARDRVLGGTELLDAGGTSDQAQDPSGDLAVSLLNVAGANSQLGSWNISPQRE